MLEQQAHKDCTTKVDQIRESRDIRLIQKKAQVDRSRDLAIFTRGMHMNLRASDLLPFTADQVCHLKAGDHFSNGSPLPTLGSSLARSRRRTRRRFEVLAGVIRGKNTQTWHRGV